MMVWEPCSEKVSNQSVLFRDVMDVIAMDSKHQSVKVTEEAVEMKRSRAMPGLLVLIAVVGGGCASIRSGIDTVVTEIPEGIAQGAESVGESVVLGVVKAIKKVLDAIPWVNDDADPTTNPVAPDCDDPLLLMMWEKESKAYKEEKGSAASIVHWRVLEMLRTLPCPLPRGSRADSLLQALYEIAQSPA